MSSEIPSVEENPLSAVNGSAKSDIGLRREENQDSFGMFEENQFRLYIVADGMGGVKGGGIASALAVSIIRDTLSDATYLDEDSLASAVEQANLAIFQRGTSDPTLAGMGTTLVGMGFVGTKAIVVNVGDSRAYRVRRGRVDQLTEDHTLVMELLRSGAIDAEQAGNHPISHMLTRSLGPANSVQVDVYVCNDGPVRGDRYLLCSDGLYNLVGPEEIADIVGNYPPGEAVEELVSLANLRGGNDNITVLIIDVGDSYPVDPMTYLTPQEQAERDAHAAEPNGSTHHFSEVTTENPELESRVEFPPPVQDEHTEPPPPVNGEASTAQPRSEDTDSGATEQQADARRERSFDAAGIFPLSDRSRRAVLLTGVLMAGFLIGHFSGGPTAPLAVRPVPVPQQARPVVAPIEAAGAKTGAAASPAMRLPALAPEAPAAAPEPAVAAVELPALEGAADVERERIAGRLDTLTGQLRLIEDRLAAFGRPLSGQLASDLGAYGVKAEQIESKLRDVRSEIDTATRRFTVWVGRRKRLQTSDPVNLASEVAVTADNVRGKKELFERATWNYLREAEVLKYAPQDPAQSRKVAELLAERNNRLDQLAASVRAAIEHEVGESERAIAELTLRRDTLEGELEALRRDHEYIRVLVGNDPRAKELKREELERERDLLTREIESLRGVVGSLNTVP